MAQKIPKLNERCYGPLCKDKRTKTKYGHVHCPACHTYLMAKDIPVGKDHQI